MFAHLTLRVTQTLSRLQQARGVTVGCSAKRAVWACGKTTLYHYLPLPEAARARRGAQPVLVCFALVNRPYILDLQPDRSLVRRLLEAGLEVYLIDWGDPDEADRRTISRSTSIATWAAPWTTSSPTPTRRPRSLGCVQGAC